MRPGDDLAALRGRAVRPRRRRRRDGDQQGGEQGRGPGPSRHPGGRAARRDRPRGRPARADHDRPDPARAHPGRGRHRRLQRGPGHGGAAAARTPTRRRARSASPLLAADRPQRRRRGDRHRRPRVARGPDRHRDRCRRAARARGPRRLVRRARQRAGGDRAGCRRRARRRGRAGPGQARPLARSPSCAAAPTWSCHRASTGPGAAALVRPDGADLFGYGAREAVVRALRGDAEDQAAFGAPADRRRARRRHPRRPHRTPRSGRTDDAVVVSRRRCADGRELSPSPSAGARSALPTTHRTQTVSGSDRPLRRLCPRRPPSALQGTPTDDHTEEPDSWPRPPRPTARRRSTRSAASRRAPSVAAGS